MDASLSKQFRITESKQVQLRFDATNVMNHPQPNNPQYSINNAAFGTINGERQSDSKLPGTVALPVLGDHSASFNRTTGFRQLTGSSLYFVTTRRLVFLVGARNNRNPGWARL
jgi:hypothetical protein